MFALIHLGTSDRIAESKNERWLNELRTGYQICRQRSNDSWRIFHPNLSLSETDFKLFHQCEFEVLEVKDNNNEQHTIVYTGHHNYV